MPCYSAMIKNVLVAKPEDIVDETIAKMRDKKNPCHTAVIVDDEGKIMGYFNMKVLLKNLLPVSLSSQNSAIGNDVIIGAAPGIAKRLRKVKPVALSQIMEREYHTLNPDDPVWEGVKALVEHGAPIFIVEEETEKFIGVINEESAVTELERIQDEQGGKKTNVAK